MRLIAGLSLTARLTLLFAAGSSAVLLALGWLIGDSIERHFQEQDRDALSGKIMLARHDIERVRTPQQLALLPQQLGDALVGHHELQIQVAGPDQQILLSTPEIVFPPQWLARAGLNAPTPLFTWSQGSHSYRGLAVQVPTGLPGAPALRVAVAVDIEHHASFMAHFMQTLWLFVLGGAVATGLLGWFAASRGLAPLRAMREQAAGVTAHKLDQRLPVEAVPPELADLARSLNAMLARLEEAFTRLSDFSSDIAHELRTPVNNLMTQTQVSLSRARDAASYRDILESNAEEFERLARMIADMLFLAKTEYGIDAAQTPTADEAIDLAQEVQQLFDFYEALADEQGVRLALHGTASVPGERLMLRRALSNLLSNALRYTPRGGCVNVTLASDTTHATVAIDNPGPTIAAQHLGRLFERFYRADPSRQSASGEGTGLGLAITQAIARAHGGAVSVRSADGHTCFTLRLPLQRAKHAD